VIASKILAAVYFLEGKYGRHFQLSGGVPVAAFTRVDDVPIRLRN